MIDILQTTGKIWSPPLHATRDIEGSRNTKKWSRDKNRTVRKTWTQWITSTRWPHPRIFFCANPSAGHFFPNMCCFWCVTSPLTCVINCSFAAVLLHSSNTKWHDMYYCSWSYSLVLFTSCYWVKKFAILQHLVYITVDFQLMKSTEMSECVVS